MKSRVNLSAATSPAAAAAAAAADAMYRQGSGESSYSQRSSDLSLDEEREHFRYNILVDIHSFEYSH